MVDTEKIIAEIRRLKTEIQGYSAQEALDYIESYINLISREPLLPTNIDEAAEEYRDTEVCTDSDYIDDDGDSLYRSFALREAFKAGAEWMAGKYKTLGETEIYLEDDGGEAPYTQEWLDLATTEFAVPEGFKPGDKVIVQIRKK